MALLAVAILVAGAAPAQGQSGNGLYEPFPEAAVKERAQRYVERLRDRVAEPGARYSDEQLARGVFVQPDAHAGLPPAAGGAHAASDRAGDIGTDDLPLPLQLVLVLAALGVPVALLAGRPAARAG